MHQIVFKRAVVDMHLKAAKANGRLSEVTANEYNPKFSLPLETFAEADRFENSINDVTKMDDTERTYLVSQKGGVLKVLT